MCKRLQESQKVIDFANILKTMSAYVVKDAYGIKKKQLAQWR